MQRTNGKTTDSAAKQIQAFIRNRRARDNTNQKVAAMSNRRNFPQRIKEFSRNNDHNGARKHQKVVQKELDSDYIKSVLFPEKILHVRCPNRFPYPTATYHRMFEVFVTPNSSGNFVVGARQSVGATEQHVITWQDNTLNMTNMTQTPAGTKTGLHGLSSAVSNQHRVVSMCLEAKYIGAAQTGSGEFTAGFVPIHAFSNESPGISYLALSNGYYTTQTNWDLGARILWIPRDDKDLDFQPSQTDANSSSTLVLAGRGFPASAANCVVVRVYINYEYIPAYDNTTVAIKTADPSAESCEFIDHLIAKKPEMLTAPPGAFDKIFSGIEKAIEIAPSALALAGRVAALF